MASRCGLKMTVLRPVAASVTTPERPTSLPVPAVVGMVMIGRHVRADELPAVDRVVVVDERPVVGDLERDELARVERRAAADRDDALGAVRPVRRDARRTTFSSTGFGSTLSKTAVAMPAASSRRAHALGDPDLDDAGVAHHEGPLCAQPLDVVADHGHRPDAEHDRRRKRPAHERFAHGGDD